MTDQTALDQALRGSVLVVAHPDDEILWFGSIAARVDAIVICFFNDPVNPQMSVARERTLRSHPWRERITCLGLDETNAFSAARWPDPEPTEYGLDIVKSPDADADYRIRFKDLKSKLSPIVQDAANVITHNPWGEYGHEEHVLVHRAATAITEENGQAIWYDNYASSWSEQLMRHYLGDRDRALFSAAVDPVMLEAIADVYRSNGAWTWFDDVDWFAEEVFIRGPMSYSGAETSEGPFRVNMLQLAKRPPARSAPRTSGIRRYLRRLSGR